MVILVTEVNGCSITLKLYLKFIKVIRQFTNGSDSINAEYLTTPSPFSLAKQFNLFAHLFRNPFLIPCTFLFGINLQYNLKNQILRF